VIDLLIISHKGMDKDKRTGLADALVNHVEYPVLTINTQPQYDWIKIEEVKA
jgi:hypothetical protein